MIFPMNKQYFAALLVTGSLSLGSAMAAQTDETAQLVEKQVLSWMNVEVVKQSSIIQKMLFDCQFYSATPVLKSPDGSESSFGRYQFYSHDGVLGSMTEPYTTQPLPELQLCIKSGFQVTNQDQAQLLFEAIETVYPNDSMFDQNYAKEIIKKEKEWHLIDGEIFDDKKGYVIKVNDKGHVTKVIRSLNL